MTPMTPMTQPTQVVMTSSGKGMTYSLDRRQVKRVPHQNSHQNFQPYINNNENPQRKRYVSESVNPKSTLINFPIIEDPYSIQVESLKKKMSLNLNNKGTDPVKKFVYKTTP